MLYRRITNIDELADFSDKFKADEFAFDTETTSIQYMDLELVGLSLFDGSNPPVFVEFNFSSTYEVKLQDSDNKRRKIKVAKEYSRTDAIPVDEAIPYLKQIFTGKRVIMHNAKFDYKVAYKYGFSDFTIADDTMIMAFLFDVNTPNGLKYCSNRYLGHKMTEIHEALGFKVSNVIWPEVDFEKFAEYGCDDAVQTYNLREYFIDKLEEMELTALYRRVELKLIPIIAKSEILGVRIHKKQLKKFELRADKELKEREQNIYDLCGVEFNINSGKQLAEVLFDRLGYPVIAKTEKGTRSTDEATLKELSYRNFLVADQLLRYRKLTKLNNTYIKSIPSMVDADGRLRGSFNQIGARTGRFSSSQPNLQNQPNDKSYPIRSAFIPRDGYVFIVADWSTIEIRIMAHESNETALIKALKDGSDVHQETADRISKVTGLPVTRQQGKTLNFAIIYGMGPDSLVQTINAGLKAQYHDGEITSHELRQRVLSSAKAKRIIDGYYAAYPEYAKWKKLKIRQATKRGYARTLGGRRRYIKELQVKHLRGNGERQVINSIIQGGAGDLMKLGAIKIDQMIMDRGYDAAILMYVHDEFVIEVKKSQAKECLVDVEYQMNNIYPECRVPIVCDAGIFSSWNEMKAGSSTKRLTPIELLKLKLI